MTVVGMPREREGEAQFADIDSVYLRCVVDIDLKSQSTFPFIQHVQYIHCIHSQRARYSIQ